MCGNVGEGGSDEGRQMMLGGGQTGSKEPSLGRWKRLRGLGNRLAGAIRRNLGGRERVLIPFALGSTSGGGLGIRLLCFGAVGGEVPCDEGGRVRVFPLSERVSFP